MKATIEKFQAGLFVALPEEVLAGLNWGHGDIVEIEVIDGTLKIVRTMTDFDHTMEIARKGMDEYSEALAALAKS